MNRNRVNLMMMQALMYSMFNGVWKPIGKRIEYEPINVKGMSAKEIGTSGKKKVKKLTVTKVQDAVNYAIRMRDGGCINHDETCKGNLEASHFFGKGGNGGLRFYPPNIHGQCSKHHFDHHQRNPLCYVLWMQENCPEELEWMESARRRVVKYSQPVLRDIYDLARQGALDELTEYIRALIVNG